MNGTDKSLEWAPTSDALRRRLAADLPCIGAWQMLPGSLITDVMVSLGYHWIAADMEHSRLTLRDAEEIFIAAERHNCVPMARMATADPVAARRLLDAGAQGLLVAMVEDVDAFDNFARQCNYPPHGTRGIGLTRSNVWGDLLEETLRDFRPFLCPQIETVAGVEALPKLLALDAVDAVFVGPYDLSASLGVTGNFDDPAMREALDAVKRACKDAGKPLGMHQVAPEAEDLHKLTDQGYRLIAYGTDTVAIRHALKGVGTVNDK